MLIRFARLVAALMASAALAACVHGISKREVAPADNGALEVLDHRDGPLALDGAGRWQPILDAQVRFAADAGALTVVALDVSKDGLAVALRHDGGVHLGDARVASGSGVVVVVLDAAGSLRWTVDFTGGKVALARVRMTSDGAVLVSGQAEASVHSDRGTLCGRPDGLSGFVWAADAEGNHVWSKPERPDEHEHFVAMDAHEYQQAVVAGELPGPRPGVEPWQAFVKSTGRDDSFRQIFGSDEPIRMWGVDASFPEWSYVTGTFAGTLGAGGRPAITSEWRTPFVAALESSGRVAWLAPIYPPARGLTLEPVGLQADDRGVHLALAAAATDGSSSLIDATLDGDGGVISSCELAHASGATQVRALSYAGELTTLVARFDGALSASGQPVTTYATPTTAALFFAERCKLLGRLESRAGETIAAVRPVDSRIVVAVDAGAAAELRWYRK